MPTRIAALALALLVALAAACGRSGPRADRCAHCGMQIERGSRWRAGLTTASGDELSFDTPKCLVRVLRSARGRNHRDAWVLEYYGSRRVRAADATFVEGSDVLGPMGPDLVPLADRAAAERFAADHGSRALLRLDDVDQRVLDRL